MKGIVLILVLILLLVFETVALLIVMFGGLLTVV